jgi:hypothetical protein
MVLCTSTSQYCLRGVGRANIRIQLWALRAATDTETATLGGGSAIPGLIHL